MNHRNLHQYAMKMDNIFIKPGNIHFGNFFLYFINKYLTLLTRRMRNIDMHT